ncbi:hypothetical protein [Actinoplanes sp. DH11]|uniref:hypothetical protein n=1 Tax=Actinoplanes sp. DH11 TaxID=2857011 RepID=UPI001E5C6CB5|nr:hypothetical protein [Actinoplanes sp. DH11]
MIEQAERFPLTTGPDGRALLTLALRPHPRISADKFARARRYWACAPGGGQPRWLALAGHAQHAQHADDAREVAEVHSAAAAYLPGVSCSGCGDRLWKPMNRRAVTQYVLTGFTDGCTTCRTPSSVTVAAPAPATPPVPKDLAPPQTVQARSLPAVTLRIDGPVAALLWSATGGDAETMSTLVTDLLSRNFGIRRPVGDLS